MSVSWAADPDAKWTCGHRRCKRTGRAGAALVCAAVPALFITLIAADGNGTLAVTTAAGIAAAGITLACWPHPRDRGLDRLMTDLGHPVPRLPRRWAAADWAELEKELSK